MFDMQSWYADLLREFFGMIDSVIFKFIGWIMEGIFNLASLQINSQLVLDLYNRIYVFLAIFMVFKLTFSFLKYLISPDMMTDKEQGVGKIIARTVTMLAILVILPTVFFDITLLDTEEVQNRGNFFTVLQTGALKTLPKIILGIDDIDSDRDTVQSNARQNGEEMALAMISAFFYNADCETETDISNSATCTRIISSLDEFKNSVTSTTTGGKGSPYRYKYMFPLTTVSGIVLIIILLGIAIDVAIRAFKLLILEIMAPVPVMSYIDPKSSKDGAFSNWLKSFVTTYIDIFVKIGSVYFLLLLLSKVFNQSNGLFGNLNEASGDNFFSWAFLRVFLIIGLFKFAKDAPKFIKNSLGIKDSGGGGGFMGKALAGMAGAAAGFAGGVAAGGGLSGGLSGAKSGFSAGSQNAGSGKPLHAYSKIRDEQAKQLGKAPGSRFDKKLQEITAGRQLKKLGMGVNEKQFAKDNMYKTAAEESDAQDAYQRFKDGQMSDAEMEGLAMRYGHFDTSTGSYVMDSNEKENARKMLYADLSSKQTAASKAKSNYDTISKGREQFGQDKDIYSEYNPGYRARRKRNKQQEQRNAQRPEGSKYMEDKLHTKGSDKPNSTPV